MAEVGLELDEHLSRDALALTDKAEQDVLGADVVVRKGECGIQILAPLRRVRAVATEDSDEPDRAQVLTGFRVVHIFDISQTEGEELPDVAPRPLDGDVPQQLVDALEKRIAAVGFMLKRETITRPSCNGYADFAAREVVLKEGLSGLQTIKTMIHELAHVLLHQESALSARAVAEVEAESIAFVVCRALGLDTSDYSLAYVARWGAGDSQVIAATAQSVITTANDILTSMMAATKAQQDSVTRRVSLERQ